MYARFYYIFFMLRRFSFVLIAMLLFEKPWLQVMLYYLISFLALGLVLNGMPFADPVSNKLEILNEVFVLFIGYHLIALSGYEMESTYRKRLGNSIIVTIMVLITVHYIRWFIGVFKHMKRRYARRQNSKRS